MSTEHMEFRDPNQQPSEPSSLPSPFIRHSVSTLDEVLDFAYPHESQVLNLMTTPPELPMTLALAFRLPWRFPNPRWTTYVLFSVSLSTDPIFANTVDVNGWSYAQVFYGTRSRYIMSIYGMRMKGEFATVYSDFLCEEGVPSILMCDNAREEKSAAIKDINRL
eukprot:Nitzschia sp. Nitz4//scaffold492_size6457//2639//3260//NITZ4_009177-RA/size6457-processed-gene-0.0-mRNA-1//-1//CDS//3329553060//8429//frame0